MAQQPFDPMEYIWERLPKNKDGKTVKYLVGDIPYLYHNGFVDTLKFSYKQWETAFIPFKQTDGTYLLDKPSFFTLRIFRYNGPSHAAFDPAKLRDGAWPDNELEHLYQKSIRPSTSITKEIFWNSVKALKTAGFVNDKAELICNERVRKQLSYLLDKFPSPRRRLEKEVFRIKNARDAGTALQQKNRDASNFVIGKTQKESEMEQFQKLQSSQAAPQAQTAHKTEGEALDLKSLRKPGGKVIG